MGLLDQLPGAMFGEVLQGTQYLDGPIAPGMQNWYCRECLAEVAVLEYEVKRFFRRSWRLWVECDNGEKILKRFGIACHSAWFLVLTAFQKLPEPSQLELVRHLEWPFVGCGSGVPVGERPICCISMQSDLGFCALNRWLWLLLCNTSTCSTISLWGSFAELRCNTNSNWDLGCLVCRPPNAYTCAQHWHVLFENGIKFELVVKRSSSLRGILSLPSLCSLSSYGSLAHVSAVASRFVWVQSDMLSNCVRAHSRGGSQCRVCQKAPLERAATWCNPLQSTCDGHALRCAISGRGLWHCPSCQQLDINWRCTSRIGDAHLHIGLFG